MYRTGQAEMPRPPRLSRLTPLSSNLRAQAQRERRFAHTEAPFPISAGGSNKSGSQMVSSIVPAGGKNPVHLKGNPGRGERRGFRSGRSRRLGESVVVLSMEQSHTTASSRFMIAEDRRRMRCERLDFLLPPHQDACEVIRSDVTIGRDICSPHPELACSRCHGRASEQRELLRSLPH